MILLDTNALIWLVQRHRRARRLETAPRLYLSPATLLELQFLQETGRIRLPAGQSNATFLTADHRWRVDEPPALRWFAAAGDLSWTRDPFDRLIASHARLRGWKLATGDGLLLERLHPSDVVAL